MSFLFLGLLEKMLRKLRQRLRREMRRDRVILQLCAELVSDLLVNGVDNFLACKHEQTYRESGGCKPMYLAVRRPEEGLGSRGKFLFDFRLNTTILLCCDTDLDQHRRSVGRASSRHSRRIDSRNRNLLCNKYTPQVAF